ncbi:MAG TPA: hypothetical protein VF593_10975 [Chthoniobacteraceae bacterium]|jgi:hypothetical protein
MNRPILTLFSVTALFVAGCAAPPASSRTREFNIIYDGPPNLNGTQAVQIAARTAINAGYDLRQYATPKVRYSHTNEHDAWFIDYGGMGGLRGNHFSVRVHDETRQAQLSRGR